MRLALLTVLLFSIIQNTNGQITGKIASVDGQPVQGVSIDLLRVTDTSFVKGTLTDGKGVYHLPQIKQGRYFLRFSSIGYQTWYSSAFLLTDSQKVKDFGTQVIQIDANQLQEVVVRAEKPLFQQQDYGTVVNVEGSVLTKGSSALEVLERSPGVIINHRDNNIELNGKSGVMVMLNGKSMRLSMEQVVSLLDGMSANDISKIELLTTPPSSYDAEGSAGMINIVMKKNKKPGTNGTVSLTGGYGRGEKGTGAINLAHNTGNINLYGSYTFSRNRTYREMYITSAQNMPSMGGDVFVTVSDTSRDLRNNHDATAGLDVRLNTKTTFGGSITYNSSKSSSIIFTNAGYNVVPDSLLQFTGDNRGTNRWNNLVNSVYIEKISRAGEKFNFDLDYLYFYNNGRSNVQSSFINKHGMQVGGEKMLFSPSQKGFATTTINVGAGKMDYEKQLRENVKLETGAKVAYTQSTSRSGIQSLVNGILTSSDQTTNNIIMREGIGAIYASVNTRINQSTNLTIGARYEYSYTNMENSITSENIVNRKLGSLFPSIFFTKKLSDRSDLQLSYTKRISRPSYNDLASYVGYSDPTAVYTGNPFLKPTISNNAKFGYNYNCYSFSLVFSRDDNAIVRYQLTESPARDILFISPKNLAWQNNVTFQTTFPLKVNNWWAMNYGFVGGLRQYRVEHTKQPFTKSYFGYSLNFSQAFKLPSNYSVELLGWYNKTSYNGTRKIDGYGILNVGIKKELGNNGGSLQLSVADFLRDERINIYYGTLGEEAFSINNHVNIYTESAKFPIIKLTYSRSFGNNIAKNQRKKVNVSEDEMDRVIRE